VAAKGIDTNFLNVNRLLGGGEGYVTETMYLTFERDFWRHFLMRLSRLCVFLVAVGQGGCRGRQLEYSLAARPQIGTTRSHKLHEQMLRKGVDKAGGQ